jgi:hypothetical protein
MSYTLQWNPAVGATTGQADHQPCRALFLDGGVESGAVLENDLDLVTCFPQWRLWRCVRLRNHRLLGARLPGFRGDFLRRCSGVLGNLVLRLVRARGYSRKEIIPGQEQDGDDSGENQGGCDQLARSVSSPT